MAFQKATRKPLFLFQNENKNISISVIRGAQLIEMNKRKLSYLSSKLKVKDIKVEEKIKADFGMK